MSSTIALARAGRQGTRRPPPLSSAVLASSRPRVGDSWFAMRVWPALTLGGTALVTSVIAERLGGGPCARSLAAPTVLALRDGAR